jgi:hypothetical protein
MHGDFGQIHDVNNQQENAGYNILQAEGSGKPLRLLAKLVRKQFLGQRSGQQRRGEHRGEEEEEEILFLQLRKRGEHQNSRT